MIITCKYIQTIFQPYRQFCNNKLQKTISLALNSYKFKLHNFFSIRGSSQYYNCNNVLLEVI